MKKVLCIALALFMLFFVPVKGYASSAVFFGMSEELVLGYLASLLGIQAKQTITTYDELIAYNEDLRYGFTEYLAGSATSMELAQWIGQAVIGNINTDSIIWEKFYEYCLSQYVEVVGETYVPSNNVLEVPSFTFDYLNSFNISRSDGRLVTERTDIDALIAVQNSTDSYRSFLTIEASDTLLTGFDSYTFNDKTVYYKYTTFTGNYGDAFITTPSGIIQTDASLYNDITRKLSPKMAWLMIYEGIITSSSISVLSGALNGVLTSSEVEDIIDGTSVLQLYNPASAQNGLQIVPDPENPEDIVIPAMLTADWYNYLKQFGSGAQQFVEAYNALNGAEGVSTGAINGLYNKLGIASAVNTATAAAQGTLTLTDNNVFPQMSTVADAVTGVIPGALTPVAPDSGITNESDQGLYKLPDLREYFPFCIPFDLINLFSCFVAEPETPHFLVAMSTGSQLEQTEINLSSWDNIASMVRTFELIGFILGLILVTRNLIRG